MAVPVLVPASLSLPSLQLNLTPKSPLIPFSDRFPPRAIRNSVSYSVSGTSVVSTAMGGRASSTSASYGSTSAIGQMNQDLLDAQARNEDLRQRQGGSTNSTTDGLNSELIQSQSDAMALLKVQIAMQRENQLFTTISNILKTRHETLKTIIGNIR